MADDVWRNHASQWERVGPPLKPSERDLVVSSAAVAAWAAEHGPPRALMLGVTPELSRLPWPLGTDLAAVDRSADMIARVWPGFPRPGTGALEADWRALPVADGTRDIVASDGPFGVLAYPSGYAEVLASVRRVLRPTGRFIFRVFVRPDAAEPPAAVIAAAMAREIGNFHAFKLRLLMALQPDTTRGVCVHDVYEFWRARGPGAEALSERCGWPMAQIATIDAYREQEVSYTFPTEAELRAALAEDFEVLSCSRPSYELGERCPTFVTRPRP